MRIVLIFLLYIYLFLSSNASPNCSQLTTIEDCLSICKHGKTPKSPCGWCPNGIISNTVNGTNINGTCFELTCNNKVWDGWNTEVCQNEFDTLCWSSYYCYGTWQFEIDWYFLWSSFYLFISALCTCCCNCCDGIYPRKIVKLNHFIGILLITIVWILTLVDEEVDSMDWLLLLLTWNDSLNAVLHLQIFWVFYLSFNVSFYVWIAIWESSGDRFCILSTLGFVLEAPHVLIYYLSIDHRNSDEHVIDINKEIMKKCCSNLKKDISMFVLWLGAGAIAVASCWVTTDNSRLVLHCILFVYLLIFFRPPYQDQFLAIFSYITKRRSGSMQIPLNNTN